MGFDYADIHFATWVELNDALTLKEFKNQVESMFPFHEDLIVQSGHKTMKEIQESADSSSEEDTDLSDDSDEGDETKQPSPKKQKVEQPQDEMPKFLDFTVALPTHISSYKGREDSEGLYMSVQRMAQFELKFDCDFWMDVSLGLC